MPNARDAWKLLKPEEQLLLLIKTVRRMEDERRFYTRLQGIRLESRLVSGQRRLYAVVDDAGASNNGAAYQLAP